MYLFVRVCNWVWVNSRWGKTVCKCRRMKEKHGAKRTLYAVYMHDPCMTQVETIPQVSPFPGSFVILLVSIKGLS